MEINQGDLVVFKPDLYADEYGAVYRVLEINGDRVILELANTNLTFSPQSIALINDLEKISSIPSSPKHQAG
jgi:hypothetical protein